MSYTDWIRGPTIGRGSSSAVVSLASSTLSGETFAVKWAPISSSATLQKEHSILSSLNCPNIISCLGCDVSADAYNLFIEYASCGSLARHGGHLDELAIRSHTRDILTGLAYLGSRGIVHCDIKGENILLGADRRARIADFGCARWIDGDDENNIVSGTPMFMAPEVARGEEQGPEADVWALGCTVIEMATGRAPWPDVCDPVAALHRIAFSSEVPVVPSWISNEGRDFIGKCLKRDPRERWSADELLQHPFVALLKSSSSQNWTSPTSTLNQEFWEFSSANDNEDDDELLMEQYSSLEPASRLQQLAGSDPDWSWDEDWTIIRSSDDCSVDLKLEEHNVEASTEDIILCDESYHNVASTSGPEICDEISVSENALEEGSERELLLCCKNVVVSTITLHNRNIMIIEKIKHEHTALGFVIVGFLDCSWIFHFDTFFFRSFNFGMDGAFVLFGGMSSPTVHGQKGSLYNKTWFPYCSN